MSTKKINKEVSKKEQDINKQDNSLVEQNSNATVQKASTNYRLFMIGLPQAVCVASKGAAEENAKIEILRTALALVENFNSSAAKQLEQDIMTLCHGESIEKVSVDSVNIALRLCNLKIVCE